MNQELIKDYYWIMVGSQRRKVLRNLTENFVPSQIKRKTELNICNVSRVLSNMLSRDIISLECEKQRLYAITEKGQTLKSLMEENS